METGGTALKSERYLNEVAIQVYNKRNVLAKYCFLYFRTVEPTVLLFCYTYHLSNRETSFPIVIRTSLSMASSLETMYVGMGLWHYYIIT